MDDISSILNQSKFVVTKRNKNFDVLKSNDGVIVSYKDGNVEGFLKKKLSESFLNESKFRQTIEMIILMGLGVTYFNTDITIVDGISMHPTYKNLQVIIKSKASTDVNKMLISKNSIIKFKTPDGETSIKRVVAVPGDEIEFDFNRVKINGDVVDVANEEPHPKGIKKQAYSFTRNGKPRKISPEITIIKLKKDEYFVMGDNKGNSVDSRKYGQINKNAIISVIEK